MVKWVRLHHLDVMRRKASEFPTAVYGPKPAYSLRQTFVGSAVAAALAVAVVMATVYPAAVASIVVGAVAGRRVVRAARRFRRTRRREGRARRVCVPKTNVCVEA